MKTFHPKDRTRREHIGTYSRVLHYSPDSEFIILALTDGAKVLGNANQENFIYGQQYNFHGRWKDGQYGPEFAFDTFIRAEPLSQVAVVKYLSETCSHVGKATAERIFHKFGGDGVRLLREDPKQIADAGILSLDATNDAAKDLERFAHVERTKVELFGLFSGRGFYSKAIDRAISTWGVRAPSIIKQNPFVLLTKKFPGAGFKRTDKFYLDMGKPANSLKRQAVCAFYTAKEDRTGSTWLDAGDVASKVIDTIPGSDPYKAMVLLRRAGWIRVRRDGDQRYISPRERADAEQRIADNVRRLSRSPSTWPTEILTSTKEGDGLPSVHQAKEIQAATSSGGCGCFTGGPGTGKTHTLSFLLKQTIAQHGPESVAVAAPTGKASVRAGESLRARGLGIIATTIHRLLGITRNGHDGDGWGFEHDRENPLDVRFLVIDESSMIDTGLMADLLDAVPDGAMVLFVGDTYQLPPVGHGSPLRDLLAAGVPQGELTEVMRNAGSIVRGCKAIKAGTPCEFDEEFDLDSDDKKNLRILDVSQADSLDTLQEVLKGMTRFDPAWETQIIVPLNDKSDLSRRKINERFGRLLNPDGASVPKNPFRIGDKIICLRNTRLKQVEPRARFVDAALYADARSYQAIGDVEGYIANGEIGRVVAISEKHTVSRFGGADVPLVMFGNAKPKERVEEENENGESDKGGVNGDFDLAWAITVHRSQGSEWPCVICLVDDAGSQIADRNYWYTAISRARSACLLIGPKTVFDRQVKRVTLNRRRTFLTELVREGSNGSD